MRLLIALLLPVSMMGQLNCSPYHKQKNVCGEEQISLNVSFGACYHYNAITYGMKYKGVFLDAVMMTRSDRMPMMSGEQYALVGYEHKIEAAVGVMNNGGVAMIGGMYPLNRWMYASLRLYQTTNKMSHITAGFRIEI